MKLNIHMHGGDPRAKELIELAAASMPEHWSALLPKTEIRIVSMRDPSISPRFASSKDGGPEWLIQTMARQMRGFICYKVFIAEDITALGQEAFKGAMVVRLCERIVARHYVAKAYERIVAHHGLNREKASPEGVFRSILPLIIKSSSASAVPPHLLRFFTELDTELNTLATADPTTVFKK